MNRFATGGGLLRATMPLSSSSIRALVAPHPGPLTAPNH